MPNFFEEMSGFSNFDSLFDIPYHDAPRDWWIVITDIKGSTKAIEEGRYKDVNTVGVASIVAMKNGMHDELFPFVFGGDGATALIPNEKREQVASELSALRHISKEKFSLDLRVGMVRVCDVYEQQVRVEVAKYLLPSKTPIALFRGGGLTKAEEIIKGKEHSHEIEISSKKETDLRTLACRWRALESQNGQYMSLLVCVQQQEGDSYRTFLEGLSRILMMDQVSSNPVQNRMLRYRSLTEILWHDFHFQKSFWKTCLRMWDSFQATLAFRVGLARWIPHIDHYRNALAEHSDYQKFDDMLRMVLDCSNDQIVAIIKLCQDFHTEGKIYYGIHLSDTAIMTCQFSGFEDGQHLHFIDGGNGGYAMAAKQLKQQIKDA